MDTEELETSFEDEDLTLEELHKRAYASIDREDNFNNGDFEDVIPYIYLINRYRGR